MQFATALAIAALISAILLLGSRTRVLAIIAACISGLEVAIAFGVVTFGINGFSVPLALGAGLAVVGALMWSRNEGKTQVSAATVLAVVGLIQALSAMKLLD